MKVFLFSDYLKSIHGKPLQADQCICEIAELNQLPDGLVKISGKLARVCMISKGLVCIKYMDVIPEESEVFCANHITCPHCGSENADSWEASDSEDEHECGTCGSVFSYVRHVEVTYSSKIVERNETVTTLT